MNTLNISRVTKTVPLALLTCLCFAGTAAAENWSDTTGKFQLDAQYVGIEGKSVVLKKPDGSTIKVPISKLSSESRARAKDLYTMQKKGASTGVAASGSASPSVSSAAAASSYQPITKYRGLVKIDPPSVPPLAPFPSDPSLQEHVDHVRTQLLAGHPEVLWHMLPDEMRNKIDSDEVRSVMSAEIAKSQEIREPMGEVFAKAIEVLATKKDFILNTQMMKMMVPPQVQNTVKEAYDPALGLIYEWTVLDDSQAQISEHTATTILNYHGPRIGGHLSEIMKQLPPGAADQFVAQIKTEQTDESTGTLNLPTQAGGSEQIEMTKYSGRWIPTQWLEKWNTHKDDLTPVIESVLAAGRTQAAAMDPATLAAAKDALDEMLAANDQQKFDAAVMKVFAALNPMNAAPR